MAQTLVPRTNNLAHKPPIHKPLQQPKAKHPHTPTVQVGFSFLVTRGLTIISAQKRLLRQARKGKK
jgi:hypothetical protein